MWRTQREEPSSGVSAVSNRVTDLSAPLQDRKPGFPRVLQRLQCGAARRVHDASSAQLPVQTAELLGDHRRGPSLRQRPAGRRRGVRLRHRGGNRFSPGAWHRLKQIRDLWDFGKFKNIHCCFSICANWCGFLCAGLLRWFRAGFGVWPLCARFESVFTQPWLHFLFQL